MYLLYQIHYEHCVKNVLEAVRWVTDSIFAVVAEQEDR